MVSCKWSWTTDNGKLQNNGELENNGELQMMVLSVWDGELQMMVNCNC